VEDGVAAAGQRPGQLGLEGVAGEVVNDDSHVGTLSLPRPAAHWNTF
jgi:hypothetical protein